MRTKIILLSGCFAFGLNVCAQNWRNNALIVSGSPPNLNLFGTANSAPIDIFTNGNNIAQFTTGASLGPGLGGGLTGDGLKIMPRTAGCAIPSSSSGSLDIWATCSNGTHIKWDGSGQISGQNNRFELWAQLNGFWFNASGPNGRYIFNQQGLEYGRIGLNHHWRIGTPGTLDAQRRLEIFDNGNVPQLRLSYNPTSTVFTDFYTTGLGDLAILPVSGTNARRVGINVTAPGNSLEINSTLAGPGTLNGTGTATGASGLRFTDLNAASTFQPNPGTGVLSVDANGDVIYVPSTGTLTGANNGTSLDITGHIVQLGNDVGQVTAQLLNDREIPMNNKSIFFSDPVSASGFTNRIQVGTYSGTPFNSLSKFTAVNGENSGNTFRIGGFFTSTSTFNTSGFPLQFSPFYFGVTSSNYKFGSVSIARDNADAPGRYIGVSGAAYGTASVNDVGVSGKAYGSSVTNFGVSGLAGSADAAAVNYGVSGVATGAGTNYGVYGSASGGSTDRAGYFDGDLEYTGALIPPSDQMFKTDVEGIESALETLKQLKPHTYKMKREDYPQFHFSDRKQYGFIAQEMETIMPELVYQSQSLEELDSAGNIIHPSFSYKSLNYNPLIPVAIQAINELNAQLQQKDSVISSMQEQISQILSNMESCCNTNHSMQQHDQPAQSGAINVDLKDRQSIVLEQNVPNPFAEETAINYFLPENISKAQILFYNAQGKLIQSVDLVQKGKGTLNVFASDLTNGIYTYTLIADGKIIETKKMVKQ